MGLGSYPLGSGPPGGDPVQEPPARPTIVAAGSAKRFDPFNRTWPIDANGFHEGVHWLETWVNINMSILLGSIPSAPNAGNPTMTITHISAGHSTKVRNRLLGMLAPRINAGQLEVVELVVETRGHATLASLDWKNLVTGETRKSEVTSG